jgi:hypothetical protein
MFPIDVSIIIAEVPLSAIERAFDRVASRNAKLIRRQRRAIGRRAEWCPPCATAGAQAIQTRLQ